MKIKNITYILIITSSLCYLGCKKLDLAPIDRYTDLTYWNASERAELIVNTIYQQMGGSGTFFYDEVLSDNAYNSRGDSYGTTSISAGLADASLSRFKDQWNDAYKCIRTCNTYLANVDKAADYDLGIKKKRIAEVRFIRSYLYYYLTNLFGDVPLVTKELSIDESRSVSRNAKTEVLQFVLSELDAAAADLPVNTAIAAADRGRITKGAVMAFKARVYLYESNWSEVKQITDKFMNSSDYGTYSLFSSYSDLFLPANEYNSEEMMDIGYVPDLRTHGEHFDFVPMAVGARLNSMAPTQELADSYIMTNGKGIKESGSGYEEVNPYKNRDPRMNATIVYHGATWTKQSGGTITIYTMPGTDPDKNAPDEYKPGGIGSRTGYYLRKYYDPTYKGNFNSGLNLILIRYADILLMNAEAKVELGEMNADAWNKTIQVIRKRAGFTDPAALNYPVAGNTKEIVRNERRAEFAFEALRFFDIKRWKIGDAVLNGWVHGAKYSTASIDNGYLRVGERKFNPGQNYLWAIPRDEIAINKNLTQNSGW